MAQQTINVGASPNDGTGTPLRTAFQYTNSNFSELYTAVGPSGNNIVVPGSATITGDLTVDTSTLKVDSANNRVGILTATPRVSLDVASGNGYVSGQFDFGGTGPGANAQGFLSYSGGNAIVGSYGNTSLLFYTNGAEQMRLNSNGLGVGLTDTTNGRLSVRAGTAATGNSAFFQNLDGTYNSYLQIQHSSNGVKLFTNSSYGGDAGNLTIGCSSAVNALIVNGSGNVGIGVTPSAWGSNYRGIQMRESYAAIFSDNGNGVCEITSNAYNDGAWKYANATKAARYQLDAVNGQHEWYTAGTGTVGGTITDFATAKMTLDASGNLLVGKTSGVNKIETVGAGVDGRGTVTGVSTVATTIYTIKQSATAAMCVVFGDDGTNGFCDIVLFLATVAPKVVSSQTLYGSPAARTYSASTTNLQLALASGTLSIRTAALSTLNT